MRAFGILVAFVALSTSTLAAPLPAAGANNGLALRHDSLISAGGAAPIDIAPIVKAEVEALHRRHDNAVSVNANVAGIAATVQVDIDELKEKIAPIIVKISTFSEINGYST